MASLTLGKLDEALKARLRARAARHGRSTAAEARAILEAALAAEPAPAADDLATAIRRRFAPLGGVEFELPPREPLRDPPRFEE